MELGYAAMNMVYSVIGSWTYLEYTFLWGLLVKADAAKIEAVSMICPNLHQFTFGLQLASSDD